MIFMKSAFVLFLSLATGYVLCVLARRETGILKTVGYTLGASIILLSLLYGLLASELSPCMSGMDKHMGGMGYMHGSKMMKSMCPNCGGMMQKGCCPMCGPMMKK